MVVDSLSRWQQYFSGPAWSCAFEFLESLGPDSEEKRVALQGDDIFAIVMSYNTKTHEEAVLEAHREYVDIQMTLAAAEGIDWFPCEMLETDSPYDAEKDAEFFHHPGNPIGHIDNMPGNFTVLFPEDAHMPQLNVGDTRQIVKKVVVKVRTRLVR